MRYTVTFRHWFSFCHFKKKIVSISSCMWQLLHNVKSYMCPSHSFIRFKVFFWNFFLKAWSSHYSLLFSSFSVALYNVVSRSEQDTENIIWMAQNTELLFSVFHTLIVNCYCTYILLGFEIFASLYREKHIWPLQNLNYQIMFI